jgi:ubiquinone/menaquinone biosynthesis C-methylase UbiE
MPEKFGADYEHGRWFADEIKRAGYVMTRDTIREHLLSDDTLSPTSILELGPGAGTWSKVLAERFPSTPMTLVDISTEMLDRAKRALAGHEHVRYIRTDILDWTPDRAYDLFFSSRVIEYIDEKRALVEKVFDLLAPGGVGFLITKYPHYLRTRVLGRDVAPLHRGQIAPGRLAGFLRSTGFQHIEVFPAAMSLPVLRSPASNLALGRLFGSRHLGFLGSCCAESYAIRFQKP